MVVKSLALVEPELVVDSWLRSDKVREWSGMTGFSLNSIRDDQVCSGSI